MGLRIGASETPALTNPALGFRLDPGEPGVLRQAPASQSTLRVAEQEGRNVRRLEADAIREGRVVTRAVTTFARGDAGSFLTTLGGLTRVESVEPRPTPIETGQEIAELRQAQEAADTRGAGPDGAVGTEGGRGGGFLSAGNAGLFNAGFRFASSDTAQAERELVAAQASIERQLVQQTGARFNLEDPEAAAAARQEVADLRRSARQIEHEINRIRLARLAELTQRTAAQLLGAAEAQINVTTGLVNAASGASLADFANPETEQLNLIA